MEQVYKQERFPPSISYESVVGPCYDQGRGRNCVGFVLAALVSFYSLWICGDQLSADAGLLYNLCKPKDGIREGRGTFLRTGLDVLVSGVPTLQKRPFSIKGYWPIDSVDKIKDHLAFTGPVPIGIQVNQASLYGLNPKAPVIKAGAFDGLHAMLVVGYDDGRAALRVRNSYGPKWGDSGHCWIPYEYFDTAAFNAWGLSL